MKRKHRKASIGNACARRRFRSPRRRAHSINVTFAPLQFEQEEELEFDNAFVLFGFRSSFAAVRRLISFHHQFKDSKVCINRLAIQIVLWSSKQTEENSVESRLKDSPDRSSNGGPVWFFFFFRLLHWILLLLLWFSILLALSWERSEMWLLREIKMAWELREELWIVEEWIVLLSDFDPYAMRFWYDGDEKMNPPIDAWMMLIYRTQIQLRNSHVIHLRFSC